MAYENIGGWAFIIGVVIAVVAGLASAPVTVAGSDAAGYVTLALVLLGLVIGFLNVGAKEVNEFLLAAVAITMMGTANLRYIPVIGIYLSNMVLNVAAFVAPAALVVALKAVYVLASKPTAGKK